MEQKTVVQKDTNVHVCEEKKEYLTDKFLKDIEDYRVSSMLLANHDATFDAVFVDFMLKRSKNRDLLIDLSKEEKKNDDEFRESQ